MSVKELNFFVGKVSLRTRNWCTELSSCDIDFVVSYVFRCYINGWMLPAVATLTGFVCMCCAGIWSVVIQRKWSRVWWNLQFQ